jgi:hypothetical protein
MERGDGNYRPTYPALGDVKCVKVLEGAKCITLIFETSVNYQLRRGTKIKHGMMRGWERVLKADTRNCTNKPGIRMCRWETHTEMENGRYT